MKIEITKGEDNPVADFFSSTSDTPETDAAWEESCCTDLSWYRIAEKMKTYCQEKERERDEAMEVASGLAIQEERVNEAQKELSSIHRWIERNHPDGFIDSLTYFQNLDRITENWYDRLDRLEIDAGRFERERDEALEQRNCLHDLHNKNAIRLQELLELCETLRKERDEAYKSKSK